MRRALVPCLLVFAAVAVVIPVGVAQAARTPRSIPALRTLGLNRCGFFIDVRVVTNNEYEDVTTLADGTTITNVTGNLVQSFTNRDTGKTIVRNVSGPSTETDRPDGTITFVGRGHNWFTIGPNGQTNTREPGLFFTTGLVTIQIEPAPVTGALTATSVSLSGIQDNGCMLLS
jgi:hypothetical protein